MRNPPRWAVKQDCKDKKVRSNRQNIPKLSTSKANVLEKQMKQSHESLTRNVSYRNTNQEFDGHEDQLKHDQQGIREAG